MKKIVFLILISFMIVGCNETTQINNKDVPKWLIGKTPASSHIKDVVPAKNGKEYWVVYEWNNQCFMMYLSTIPRNPYMSNTKIDCE